MPRSDDKYKSGTGLIWDKKKQLEVKILAASDCMTVESMQIHNSENLSFDTHCKCDWLHYGNKSPPTCNIMSLLSTMRSFYMYAYYNYDPSNSNSSPRTAIV